MGDKPQRLNVLLHKYPAPNHKWTSEIEGYVNDLRIVNGSSVQFRR